MSDDLAVLGQDPRLGGGALAQSRAFVDAARDLGRGPSLHYLAYRGLTGRPAAPLGADTGAIPQLVPGLDAVNQFAAALRIAPALRRARTVWVVSTVASHGYGAVRSGRRYGCWVGTSLDGEWRSRRHGLGMTRRAARTAGAPTLRRLERAVLRRATALYATSVASRAAVAEAAALEEDAVSILPIPIDVERFTPLPDDDWERRLERPLVVFVGRASDPRKNVGLLLDAFALLRRRLPDAQLRLVGEPPVWPVDEVEIVGEVPAVEAYLREAALFVLPSLQEGFGIVAAEALAAGVPVVSTPSGGPEALLRASGGGRVLSGFDAEELAEVAAGLLEDPVALRSMRRQGRDYVLHEHGPDRFRALLADALAKVDGDD